VTRPGCGGGGGAQVETECARERTRERWRERERARERGKDSLRNFEFGRVAPLHDKAGRTRVCLLCPRRTNEGVRGWWAAREGDAARGEGRRGKRKHARKTLAAPGSHMITYLFILKRGFRHFCGI
jgi:hypothetical protein